MFFPCIDLKLPVPLWTAGHTLMFSPRRRQKPRLQHLSVQKAFAATAIGKAMLKLTPNSSMWQRAVLLVGEAACLHMPLSEMAVAAFSLGFLPQAVSGAP